DSMALRAAAVPIEVIPAVRVKQQEDRARRGSSGEEDRRMLLDRPRHQVVGRRDQCGRGKRYDDRQGQQPVHPETSTISAGSSVFACSWMSSASDRINATTVTLTTMSVRVSAWTTGSTTREPGGIP